MGSRLLISLLLAALLVVLQLQIWFGQGSVASVARLQAQLETQKRSNSQARIANDQISAEISDLQEGLEMVEERARSELGMVKADEIYVQIAH